jgi:hypothetical protein
MRRQEIHLRRESVPGSVPAELLPDRGLWRGSAGAASFRCTDPQAVLLPIAEITPPARNLNPEVMRSLLRAVRDSDDIPPVIVFRERLAVTAELLDGLHRYWVSVALNFALIPAIEPSRDAEHRCR